MREYREVNSMFEGLKKHIVSSDCVEDTNQDEEVIIEGQILETLDDGMEIELCLWTDREIHMSFWDVSIDKKMFDENIKEDFLTYLKKIGLYLENIKIAGSTYPWRYCGLIDMEKVYRIQYLEERDTD